MRSLIRSYRAVIERCGERCRCSVSMMTLMWTNSLNMVRVLLSSCQKSIDCCSTCHCCRYSSVLGRSIQAMRLARCHEIGRLLDESNQFHWQPMQPRCSMPLPPNVGWMRTCFVVLYSNLDYSSTIGLNQARQFLYISFFFVSFAGFVLCLVCLMCFFFQNHQKERKTKTKKKNKRIIYVWHASGTGYYFVIYILKKTSSIAADTLKMKTKF